MVLFFLGQSLQTFISGYYVCSVMMQHSPNRSRIVIIFFLSDFHFPASFDWDSIRIHPLLQYDANNSKTLNMSPHDMICLHSAFSFISFVLLSPFFIPLTPCIYLSATVCLIHFPPSSFFISPFGTLSFSSSLCLHLLITHSVRSSITLSGLPPSHPSSSVCPLKPHSFSLCSKCFIHLASL